jgi:spore coat-associated protein S
LDEVLSNYDIKVSGIRNETYKDKKGVWWIKTSSGMKVLKKISNSESTLKFILSAVSHLTQNGVLMPAVNKAKDGRDFVNINDTCYVLLDAIEGKNPTYGSQHLAIIVREMARFHKASAGFRPPPDSKPKCHLGTWIDDYQQQIEDMNSFYKKELEKKAADPIGKTVIEEFPYFYSRAWKAIEGLRCEEYAAWVNKAKSTGCLCHQDFAAGNLVLTASGKLYVLDTDSITIDIPARDIRKLLNKVMKKNGKWDVELTKKIFGYYQSENPLTRDEWKVVGLDILFPHLFIGAMNKYYYQRDKEWSKEKYLERIKEMSALEKTITPVMDRFDSLIPA